MKKVIFVCMGNICRSPAAEGIMKQLIKNEKLEDQIYVDSAGTLDFHTNELPDERMRLHAKERGYFLDSLARQFNPKIDFEKFDYIVTMDDYNFKVINDWDKNKTYTNKIFKMKDFSSDKSVKEVPDPYYGESEKFEEVLDILEDTTKNLLTKIRSDIARDNKK
jgi:protein-tyrosine phosphatase